MGRAKRIWYLSPMRAAKVQARLRIRAVSPEPSLLAHTSSESRWTFRQKARSLAPLKGWACAVEICHDGMLEDTNSLDGAQMSLNIRLKWLCDGRYVEKYLMPTRILRIRLRQPSWEQVLKFKNRLFTSRDFQCKLGKLYVEAVLIKGFYEQTMSSLHRNTESNWKGYANIRVPVKVFGCCPGKKKKTSTCIIILQVPSEREKKKEKKKKKKKKKKATFCVFF